MGAYDAVQDARSETRYEWDDADEATERAEEWRWFGGDVAAEGEDAP